MYKRQLSISKDGKHPLNGKVKQIRQQSKPFNFGKPGGMGDATLLKTTRKALGRKDFAKLELTEATAAKVSKEWRATWPEMDQHFWRIEKMVNASPNGRASVETLFTGRIRGNATFCATANNGFQALGSDCAKNAVWLLAKAAYVDPGSPLFNSRPNIFVHDEVIAETPYAPDATGVDIRAHNAAVDLGRVMVNGANVFLPDVPIAYSRMAPVMMRRWYKKAESVFVDHPTHGRVLVPWEPEEKPAV